VHFESSIVVEGLKVIDEEDEDAYAIRDTSITKKRTQSAPHKESVFGTPGD
jgi:hypothetical protein